MVITTLVLHNATIMCIVLLLLNSHHHLVLSRSSHSRTTYNSTKEKSTSSYSSPKHSGKNRNKEERCDHLWTVSSRPPTRPWTRLSSWWDSTTTAGALPTWKCRAQATRIAFQAPERLRSVECLDREGKRSRPWTTASSRRHLSRKRPICCARN